MSQTEPASTDEPIVAAHPARLASFAMLHGLRTELGERFRYLQLGCGAGRHLLALAARFPAAAFVGVDACAEAIEKGERAREAATLDNLQLVRAELGDNAVSTELERFDFVVAHGQYSWLEPDGQQRLLAQCAACLAASGVAQLSYNTFPGWKLRTVLRDQARAAAQGAPTQEAGLRSARAALDELARRNDASRHPYNTLLAAELGLAAAQDEGELWQDLLAEHNEPVYFRTFVRRAAEHGLAYLAESLPATADGELELELLGELGAGADRVEAEQLLDLLAYRQLRATLLCHRDAPFREASDDGALRERGYFAARLVATSEEPLLGPGKSLGFRGPTGCLIEVDRPLLKAALLLLAQAWPAGMTAPAVVAAAIAELRARGLLERCEVDRGEMESTVDELVSLWRRRLIELLPWSPTISRSLPPAPRLHPVTRMEAEQHDMVTSARHEPLPLDALTRAVLLLFDGSRDLPAVAAELGRQLASGALELPEELAQAHGDAKARLELVQIAALQLQALGLLVG